MTFSKPNRSDAILAKNRTPNSISPFSGLCATCNDECPGLCEVGKSAYRGKEVLYPQPFGRITAGSEKDYPVDYSHFNIMGTAVGAHGVEADSDVAIFPNVDVSTEIGVDNKIKLETPIVIAGMGSTNIAGKHWEGMAAGAAITGSIIVIGENVCGMDPKLEIKNGRVTSSPNLESRVNYFRNWYQGAGATVVQANVEDTRLGVQEYAIEKLGVEAVEVKWGQGAKDIGGEVKIDSLEKAQELKKRGYIVLPDPEKETVIKAFKAGAFKEFERHSRVGMVEEEAFHKRVQELRSAGAKQVFLKTGAYRPADLARAVKFASDAKIDLLTVDAAGGGTGMSPWRMMNEWGVPMVELHSLLYKYLKRLQDQGRFVPNVSLAAGFSLEDHMFKGFALGAPFVKAIGMSRTAVLASFVGENIASTLEQGKPFKQYSHYGNSIEEICILATELKEKLGDDFKKLPPGAIGIYTYFDRLKQGLRQLMCGSRKFRLDLIERTDIATLTREAAEISGITYITEVDEEEVNQILN
ncbi:FMN-binding glutamate synthase family protein [Desulfuribacillus alkaliarsenatis]|uniref:Glutamate synthase n=1 Tax=Desulfuribacillus alkaliarsenatis TaxID=766136 RepID=A0A1E5G368_9FIRM|nr:FMN-binding glutamate synthase family protein [Desulfuribacillus alkaliarsenatis]OEF97481.1 glutamate synthase [Desulfuribacillus alkaliarsenatis]